MRKLNSILDTALDTTGATEIDKAVLVGFLENQAASAIGRVVGITNNIADMERQKADAEAEAERIGAMLSKFTIDVDV